MQPKVYFFMTVQRFFFSSHCPILIPFPAVSAEDVTLHFYTPFEVAFPTLCRRHQIASHYDVGEGDSGLPRHPYLAARYWQVGMAGDRLYLPLPALFLRFGLLKDVK
jgi:hypothetical protein